MSEPPNTPSSIIHHNHQHHHHQQQQSQQYFHHHLPHHHQPPPPPPQQPYVSPITTPIPSPCPSPSPSSSLIREYRKGNWTLHETLVLITAKKLDDERRTKGSSSSASATTPPDPSNPNSKAQLQSPSSSTRTAELRWKWVENYCWNNGCLRSQNQCNDKWDNLLRDYKKVREYESRSSSSNDLPSYWKLEKHERKERNLPTNLVLEVYEALNEVVHRRYATPKTSPAAPPPLPPPPPPPPPAAAALPAPPPPPPPPPQTFSGETTESSESNQTVRVDSEMKRRRKLKNVGSSVLKSASVLAQTLMNCEEKKEKRHKDIVELEERKLQIEENRNEVNREGIAGLISAVNNLSGAIQAFVSDRQHNRGSS